MTSLLLILVLPKKERIETYYFLSKIFKIEMSLKQNLILLVILTTLNGYELSNKNGLNIVNYTRVLDDIKPLIPIEPQNKYNYEDTKLIIKIDKECSDNNYINGNKNHTQLFNDILNIYNNCIYMINREFGDNNDGIYNTHYDWFIFVRLNHTIQCLNNNIINYKHYCISGFHYSRILRLHQNPKCSVNENNKKLYTYCFWTYIC